MEHSVFNKLTEVPPAPFNEFLCPQIKDFNVPFPTVSEFCVKAKAIINLDAFDNVYDWRYPWQTMPNFDVDQYNARNAKREDQRQNVDHYELLRGKYWKLIDYFPMPFGVSSSRDINLSYGVSVSHSQSKTVSISEEIGFNLGLNLAPNFLGPIPAVAAVAAPSNGGIFPSLDFGFSGSLSRQMSFTVDDQQTWDFSVSKTESLQFSEGYYYLYWQLCEALSLYAVDKDQGRTLLSKVPVYTHNKQFQSLPLTSDSQPEPKSEPKCGASLQHPPLTTPQYTLKPGCSDTFCTYPVGMPKTMLYVKGSDLGEGHIACRPVLCCAKQDEFSIPQGHPQVEIELKGKGALNVVTNIGAVPLVIWSNR